MLKNLKYLIAVGLIAFGYANQANALFGSCTASLGREGGPKAFKCVEETTADKDPNFLAAFSRYQCKGNLNKAQEHYCEIAEEKLNDADEIVTNKRNASNKRKADSLSQKTAKAKASAKEKNRKAQAGEDDGFMANMKSKFSKFKPKQQVDEDEDQDEDMRPAKRSKYSQVDEDEDEDMEEEEEEEEQERPALKRSASARSSSKAKPSVQRRNSSRF